MSPSQKREMASQYGLNMNDLGLDNQNLGIDQIGAPGNEISSEANQVLYERIIESQDNRNRAEEYRKNNTPIFERDNSSLSIGSNTYIGGATLSCANNINIGNNVQIAWGVIIMDHNSHSLDYKKRKNDLPNTFKNIKTWEDVTISEVKIHDDVWIGVNSVILKGVTIGKGSIIAAGSVVTKDAEPMIVVGGNPAKILKRLE